MPTEKEYLTKESFTETTYQKKLTAGANINIDGNNVISATSGGTPGSTVSVTADYVSGTKLATITIDGTPSAIYNPDRVFTGVISTNDGERGLVPKPYVGDEDKVLYGSGGWRSLPLQTTVIANPPATSTLTLEKLQVGHGVYGIPEPTTVIANPSSAPTSTLEKLQVGSVTYEVGGGGGSSIIPNPQDTPTSTLSSIKIDSTTYEVGSGGSNVSITPSFNSGVKIADYSIDGAINSLYQRSNVLSGVDTPPSTIGTNQDIYIQYQNPSTTKEVTLISTETTFVDEQFTQIPITDFNLCVSINISGGLVQGSSNYTFDIENININDIPVYTSSVDPDADGYELYWWNYHAHAQLFKDDNGLVIYMCTWDGNAPYIDSLTATEIDLTKLVVDSCYTKINDAWQEIASVKQISEVEYDNLPDTKNQDGIAYFVYTPPTLDPNYNYYTSSTYGNSLIIRVYHEGEADEQITWFFKNFTQSAQLVSIPADIAQYYNISGASSAKAYSAGTDTVYGWMSVSDYNGGVTGIYQGGWSSYGSGPIDAMINIDGTSEQSNSYTDPYIYITDNTKKIILNGIIYNDIPSDYNFIIPEFVSSVGNTDTASSGRVNYIYTGTKTITKDNFFKNLTGYYFSGSNRYTCTTTFTSYVNNTLTYNWTDQSGNTHQLFDIVIVEDLTTIKTISNWTTYSKNGDYTFEIPNGTTLDNIIIDFKNVVSGGMSIAETPITKSIDNNILTIHLPFTTDDVVSIDIRILCLYEYKIPVFNGATASLNGSPGLVPAPKPSDMTKFLCGNGTWATPSGGGGGGSTCYLNAGQISDGIGRQYMTANMDIPFDNGIYYAFTKNNSSIENNLTLFEWSGSGFNLTVGQYSLTVSQNQVQCTSYSGSWANVYLYIIKVI